MMLLAIYIICVGNSKLKQSKHHILSKAKPPTYTRNVDGVRPAPNNLSFFYHKHNGLLNLKPLVYKSRPFSNRLDPVDL